MNDQEFRKVLTQDDLFCSATTPEQIREAIFLRRTARMYVLDAIYRLSDGLVTRGVERNSWQFPGIHPERIEAALQYLLDADLLRYVGDDTILRITAVGIDKVEAWILGMREAP